MGIREYLGDYDSVTEACETFCNVISSYGYQPMVYSNRNRWYNNFDGEKIASKYKVWMAAYFGKFYYDSVRWTYGDELPNFRYHYDMWQYSSRCYVERTLSWFGGYRRLSKDFEYSALSEENLIYIAHLHLLL